MEEARLEYAQKLGERKQRRMQRAIPSAKVENTHADQISPRSHVTEKVEALKAMKKIQEDKVAQEKDDLRLRMEYLSQAAFQSKDKYVRNSYQIFGPPVGFKGFQAPPANKSKHPIPSRFVSPPRHGSPVASMQIGLSMESIEGHVHRVDTKASSIGALESQLSLLNSSRRNSHDATYLTEGSTDAEGDSTVINEDIEVSRLKFNPSIVSIQEDIELTVEPVIAPMVTEILEVEVDSGAEGNEEYVDEDFTEAIQVYEDVFDKAHLMHFGEGTIRIKSFYAESPHASGTYKLDLADDAWTLDDAFRKLEEKKSTESYIDEAVEEMSEEERYITKFPVDEEEAELSDGDRYDDTFEGSEQIPLVAEVEPEPNSKPIGDNSFSQDHSVHFEDGPQEMDESHVNSSRLKSPPIATNISFTMERTDTADYYDAEDFEVEEDDKISNALAQKIMTKEQNASFHKSSDVFDQPEEIHALSILNQQKNSASRSTKQLNSATRSSSAAYEEEFESYDDEIFEFN